MKREIIPRHTKCIEVSFTNLNTKCVCFRITMPYDVKRDMGVSKIYKKFKTVIANCEQVSEWRIVSKHRIIDAESIGRIIYEWPGGIVLDVPNDATAFDYSIIQKQIEVIGMSVGSII